MFRDEQFMARVWEEANKRLTAERPAIEKEIAVNLVEAEKQDLEAWRERLELPAIDREMPETMLGEFEKVMAEGTNGQKKDLRTSSAAW